MAPVCQGDESFGQHVELLLQSRVNAEVRSLAWQAPGNYGAHACADCTGWYAYWKARQ